MAEYLVYFKLFDLILDLALGRVDLPHIDTGGEAILLIDQDLGFHDKVPAKKDVEQVWTRAYIVDYVIDTVFLLAEVCIHLLDDLRCPGLEERDLL